MKTIGKLAAPLVLVTLAGLGNLDAAHARDPDTAPRKGNAPVAQADGSGGERTVDRSRVVELEEVRNALKELDQGLRNEIEKSGLAERFDALVLTLEDEQPDLAKVESALDDLGYALGDVLEQWDTAVTEPIHSARGAVGKTVARIREHLASGGPPGFSEQVERLSNTHEERLAREALRIKKEKDPQRRALLRERFVVLMKIRKELEKHGGRTDAVGELQRQRLDVYAPIVTALVELDGNLDLARLQAELVRLKLEVARETVGLHAELVASVRIAGDLRGDFEGLFGTENGFGRGLSQVLDGLGNLEGDLGRVAKVLSGEVKSTSALLGKSLTEGVNVADTDVDAEIERYARKALQAPETNPSLRATEGR